MRMTMTTTATRGPGLLLALGVLVGVLHVPALAAQEPAVMVFRDVSVLTMQSDTALRNRTLITRGPEITWLGPAGQASVPDGAKVIDGTGRYLMPGLADMHVHASRSDLSLFLANGVTTIREMNGADWHVAVRDSVREGTFVGPRMLVASTLLAGEEQPWRHELVGSAEAAYAVAHRAREIGFDYLKVYDGLSAEAYAALAEASNTLGLPLTGHIPAAVGLDGVLASGQRSVEHAEQIMYATVGHRPDPSRVPEIVAKLAGTGVRVAPTLASQQMLALARTPAYDDRLDRPEMRFVDPGIMGWWASLGAPEGATPREPDDPRRRRAEAFYGFLRDLTLALYEAGVPLLVGTDTPNPLLVPGYSIHLELAALVDAGISRFDVLRAATDGAARFAGAEGEWGVIRVGAAADLLLLAGNPLDDLSVLEAPVGVMVAGRWLDGGRLDD